MDNPHTLTFRKGPLAFAVSTVLLGVFAVLFIAGSPNPSSRTNSSSASSLSDYSCSAPGAKATRIFVPSGLEPNTTTDSTSAIQDTIDDAASLGGGIVALPAGTFFVDGHLILKDNVELTGTGKSTVLKAGPSFLDSMGPNGGYPLITTSGASNVTIADLTADQSGNELDANAYQQARLSAYLIDIRNSQNVVLDEVYTRNPFTYSIAVVGSSDFCITHCNTRVTSSGLYYGLDGIHILDSHDGQVIDNYVDQRMGTDGDDGLAAQTRNAPVYDVLYARNTVRGGNDGDGMQLAVGNYPIYNLTIQDNNFWGSPFGIRTGYWNTGSDGAVHNITIKDNYIHDLVPGKAFPDGGNAIDIGGFGAIASVTDVTITNNLVCDAGIITAIKGIGHIVADNRYCFS